MRASAFVLAEGITPGNVDQPYIARRLIRRSVRYGQEVGIQGHFLAALAEVVIPTLSDIYPELEQHRGHILNALEDEETRFHRTLERGEKEFFRAVEGCKARAQEMMPGEAVFHLYDTYGFPPELTQELAQKQGLTADMEGFRRAFEEHQAKSRAGATARFRGGLAERSPETTKLHTATHLLHAALRQVLGNHVEQRGSNITVERLRFDFSHPDRLTEDQVSEVENIVNAQIQRNLPVTWEEMSVDKAKQSGAIGLFEERYGERVKVYSIGDFSKEICGGPHVESTGDMGHFRVLKDESIGSGVRRIKAILEA